ncbi:hypothetical protein BXY66_3552 [Shimia isoporae]|uniref:Sulfotransferase family protein n=1 Tax=Shimia isoporae TaxID=647720 RepID=A0A4R1N167_9RHOB|nr:hypothetical protein [Shimia isoporae]TCK99848.1 hypothetical protein BXY66_3552 [Shimia isoporae]
MTFKNVTLHIGRHKSGTSSLQHWLGLNRETLADNGVLYPLSGASNQIAHHQIAEALKQNATQDVMAIAEDILKERKGQETLLLSSEAFQNLEDLDGMKNMLAHLGAENVTVICYVREHLDYAVSAYRQLVHAQTKSPSFSKYCFRFHSIAPFFQRWRSVGDLQLALYHRDLLKNGDIIEDFCEKTGLPFKEMHLGDRNPSIGGNLLVYKLFANRLGMEGLTYAAMRELALAEPRFRSAFFVSDEAAASLRANSKYNASIEVELGLPPLKSWEKYRKLPDLETLESDFEHISEATRTQFDEEMLTKAKRSQRVFVLSPDVLQ